jgi:hypothetical protein
MTQMIDNRRARRVAACPMGGMEGGSSCIAANHPARHTRRSGPAAKYG